MTITMKGFNMHIPHEFDEANAKERARLHSQQVVQDGLAEAIRELWALDAEVVFPKLSREQMSKLQGLFLTMSLGGRTSTARLADLLRYIKDMVEA